MNHEPLITNIVDFSGNQVIVKDNHGNIKTVHRKDVQPVEMDIATAEFFRKEREKSSTLGMLNTSCPSSRYQILTWKFDENVNQVVAVKPKVGKQGEHSPCTPETPEAPPNADVPLKVEELKGSRSRRSLAPCKGLTSTEEDFSKANICPECPHSLMIHPRLN